MIHRHHRKRLKSVCGSLAFVGLAATWGCANQPRTPNGTTNDSCSTARAITDPGNPWPLPDKAWYLTMGP